MEFNLLKPHFRWRFCIAFLLLMLFCQNNYSPEEEEPDGITFFKMLGTSIDEIAYMSRQTSDSGYITVGFSAVNPLGGPYGAYLLRTDVYGNEKWSKTYSFGSYTDGRSVIQTNDGGFIVFGDTYVQDSAGNFLLLKTDKNGNQEWMKTCGTNVNEESNCICQTSDNGFAITGFTAYQAGEGFNVYLVKTDESGNKEWDNTFGGDSVDWGSSVVQTADDGFIVVGMTKSYGAGKFDIYIIKTDKNGQEEWSETYGGAYKDEALSIQPTIDNGYIVTGYSSFEDGYDYRVFLLKLDNLGKEEWYKTVTGEGYAIGRSIQQCSDGGFIIAGENFVTNYNENAFLVKTDRSGTLQWWKSFGGVSTDIAEAVIQTYDGGYLVTGRSYDKETSQFDFLLVKTDRNGLVEF